MKTFITTSKRCVALNLLEQNVWVTKHVFGIVDHWKLIINLGLKVWKFRGQVLEKLVVQLWSKDFTKIENKKLQKSPKTTNKRVFIEVRRKYDSFPWLGNGKEWI